MFADGADGDGTFVDVDLVGFQQFGLALVGVDDADQLGVGVLELLKHGARARRHAAFAAGIVIVADSGAAD